jgi:membrane-associated protease RseP (regulator of RpoE activity)
MTVLLYIFGVVIFVVGLAISIGLHEFGHMIPAKRFGVRVPQWFIGFGPTLWSKQIGESEYGVKAFPLGGYVKILGMLPPSPGEDDDKIRKSNTGMFAQLISDARSAEYELVQPGDEDRLFYQIPWWKKVIVMAGGPIVNILIAFFLFGGIFAFHGVVEANTTVDSVSDCVIAVPIDATVSPKCTAKDPVSPAKKAGLLPGDKITAFNGTTITSYDQLQSLIRANKANAAALMILRDGKQQVLHTTTAVNSLPTLGTQDVKVIHAGFLGITPAEHLVTHGPLYTVDQMGSYTWDTVTALGHMPVKLYGVARTVLGLQTRDPSSPMSVVGASRVAGEVVSDRAVSVGDRIAFFVSLLAGVNLFVGMFNFVPLLPLDGGHIAGALYDGLRRGLAKLFRRPDPGHFDVAKLLPVAYVMAGALLLMTVLLVYADIVAPVAS